MNHVQIYEHSESTFVFAVVVILKSHIDYLQSSPKFKSVFTQCLGCRGGRSVLGDNVEAVNTY